MSSAVHMHSQLVAAGVDAQLHVWDGMWHAFFMDVRLPESWECFDVIARFFEGHLGREPRPPDDTICGAAVKRGCR